MASANDKARFYLEQSVPDLREYERKAIFTRDEISAITRKRAGFEHVLNSPGAPAPTFARYAEYEMNLDTLRQKRVKRLGIKDRDHSGQKRIFSILNRATKRHRGDVGLWMQYIEYARKERAHKRLEEILTSVLRLHPTKPQLWIYAARYAAESDGDVAAGRNYLQRGLRFCVKCRSLWLEYMKLEMLYIAKIEGRRQVFGGHIKIAAKSQSEQEEGADADMIQLPDGSEEALAGDASELASDSIDKLEPILNGAIPIAVFDAAMKDFDFDLSLAEEIFDMITDFSSLPCSRTILQHIWSEMEEQAEDDPLTILCSLRMVLMGADPTDPEFPSTLGATLARINGLLKNNPLAPQMAYRTISSLLAFLRNEELDSALRKVLGASVRRLTKEAEEGHQKSEEHSLGALLLKLEKANRAEDAHALKELLPTKHTQVVSVG
ncbi:hypothetical protein P152DRAFT_420640 [Eremomyces bilateralis CBS 781.70]|uniref:U3 small nucleolar RNA-associated protein 6 N-terminal domain-containing protein n=1 Tax=Eremomyces bilateralis CBS 781.70 TaxID=1392243 RepID=A0A6G1FXU2_9PEZI|nr:uncharacterized protein P152DRAFT_420640 [Eremomyces bilateralis CBS 781.70]KAF1810657.1 hypothetical protein P152DRAFT_420640 [Eremomyces bilateralis CBS 781.70]